MNTNNKEEIKSAILLNKTASKTIIILLEVILFIIAIGIGLLIIPTMKASELIKESTEFIKSIQIQKNDSKREIILSNTDDGKDIKITIKFKSSNK